MSKQTTPEPPTMKAVLVYAEELGARAHRMILNDVYAKPYYPTTAHAQRLCRQLGPQGALDYLEQKSAQADGEARRDAQEAQHTLARHVRRQSAARRDEDARRAGMTPGARIDAALAKAATLSSVGSAPIGLKIKGGEGPSGPPRMGDLRLAARRVAVDAAEKIEHMVRDVERRDMRRAA